VKSAAHRQKEKTMSLTQIERAWFTTAVGGAEPTEALTSIKKRYWLGLGLAGSTYNELERAWLISLTAGTGSDADLWKLAAAVVAGTSSNYQ
jgi:hypothetical protein